MRIAIIRKLLIVPAVLMIGFVAPEPLLSQDTPPQQAAESKEDTPPQQAAASKEGTPPQHATESKEDTPPQQAAASKGDTPAVQSTDTPLQQAITELQAQLDAQSKLIEKLQQQYTTEVNSRQQEIVKQNKQIGAQTGQIDTQRKAIQSLQQQLDQSTSLADKDLSESEKKLRSRLETVEDSIKSSQQAESTQYDLDKFPGSLPIPGSSAAIKFGGFVKMNVVESFDPIGTNDRFIVGTIPVPQESGPTNTALTVSQSRLNVELRDTTQYGAVRAFLEGDFAGSNNTFRLRHAFGQYKSFLVGKTWSTFMDTRSRPEDLDFEGINGQILLRQAQIRYFPSIGKDWHLLISAEDPQVNVLGGTAISQIPDMVVSVERAWFDDWHVKSSLLLRRMNGTCNCLEDSSDTTTGWAVSVSGMTSIKLWDKRDNLQLQLNYGEGFSNYVNDLGDINAPDAIFNEQTGNLEAVPVFSTYIAFQKWWSSNLRSNFNYSYVAIDFGNIAEPTAYKSTQRLTGNIIWSPVARIDLGAQVLFGSRTNQNKEKATAKQLQLSAKYRF